jgi:NitT/TauT family transport system substrate-binding protein
MRTIRTLVAAGALLAFSAAHAAVDLTVTHFGTGMYGVPFAVAKAKGWFKSEANLDVGGFITSKGGGTTVRNALAADLPYGEVALSAAIVAIQQGAEITIIHSGVISVADQMWSTRKDDTSIKTYADLKGKVLGYSSPRSVTDMITTIMLNDNGLTDKVTRKSVGGVGAGVVALREGGVDMTYMTEPVWSKEKNNFRGVWRSSDIAPKVTQTVGIVKTSYLKANPKVVEGIINARRKGVQFIRENPDEAAKIMAVEYKITPENAASAIKNVLSVKNGYWSEGGFDYEGMETLLKGLRLVKAIPEGDFDWSKVVTETALPADLRSKK